jgi:hypothetical protein
MVPPKKGNPAAKFSAYYRRSPARAILGSTIPQRGVMSFRPTQMLETVRNCNTRHRGSEMGSGVLHWVVQRDAKTGALITFASFADYKDATRRKAELEAVGDPLDHTAVVAIESLPAAAFPK